jgi:hypothetical protein
MSLYRVTPDKFFALIMDHYDTPERIAKLLHSAEEALERMDELHLAENQERFIHQIKAEIARREGK